VRYAFMNRALTLFVLGVIPAGAAGQLAFPTTGTRVRVSAPSLEIAELTGDVVRVSADSLTIGFPAPQSPMTLSIQQLSRLEVSRGMDHGAGAARGAKYGVLFLGLAGAAFSVGQYGCEEYCVIGVVGFVAGGALAGFLLGGIIGSAFPVEKWEEVSLTFGPAGPGHQDPAGNMRLGLRLTF
jgi:hypothetical protein